MGRAIGVFAGVFHVDRKPGEVFQYDFARQTGVPAGTAGGDDEALAPAEQLCHRRKGRCGIRAPWAVAFDGRGKCSRLLVDFTKHCMGKARCVCHCRFHQSQGMYLDSLYGRLYYLCRSGQLNFPPRLTLLRLFRRRESSCGEGDGSGSTLAGPKQKVASLRLFTRST